MHPWLRRTLHLSLAIAVVCAILIIEFRFHGLHNVTVTSSLLLAILYFAVRWNRLETIAASVVAALGFLLYFQPPIGSFKASDPQSYIAVAGFLITAIVVSQTALTARLRAAEALERKAETDRLYELGQALLATESLQATVWIAIHQGIRIFGASGAAFYLQSSAEFHPPAKAALFSRTRCAQRRSVEFSARLRPRISPFFQCVWVTKLLEVSAYAGHSCLKRS